MNNDDKAQPLVRGELHIFELPSRTELPAHVRRIRTHHENSGSAAAPDASKPLVERNLEELDVRIG